MNIGVNFFGPKRKLYHDFDGTLEILKQKGITEDEISINAPEIIDMPLLRQHLEMMADCKPVEMPIFDFAGQRRSDKTIPVHRKPGEIIVMEGIHALNPQVLGQETDLATGIYISVRTRVQDDNGFVLHPSRIRLARRLLRDFRHRGQDYAATVQKLRSVSRGERLYIDPNKNNAAIQFDTFIPYELAVYRNEIIHGLMNKKMDTLKVDLPRRCQEGMQLARALDSRVRIIKKGNRIRRNLKLKTP